MTTNPLQDDFAPRPVRAHEVLHQGLVWSLVRDTVDLGEAGEVRREYVEHPGSVGCVALDREERVLLLQQYRHPTRMLDWELPAGLLDVAGEAPWEAAARELAEEADLVAGRWHVLADWQNSPGGSSENWRCFLAREVAPAESAFEREHEEATIVQRWVPLAEVVEAVLDGRIRNACTVAGVLAAYAARESGWRTLRPHDTAWPAHPAYR